MHYSTFQIGLRTGTGMKWVDVIACDIDAAKADIAAAYLDAEIVTWMRVR